MDDNHLRTYLFIAITAITFPISAEAAQIVPSNDPECRVDISGPIERGDFAALLTLESHLIVHDGESTNRSVVCLDSPGGSVIAGLAMAEYFLTKGISTRIRQNAECHSICAIMFMMGNYRGSEVAGLSRQMHVTSQLGFHRPYLSLQEAGLYTSGDIVDSYKFGVTSIFEILTLANQREPWGAAQMIEPDLMQRITGTPGNDIFLVTTVEEALRWKIAIDGIPAPQEIGKAHLFFACENALATRHILTTELAGNGLVTSDIFELAPLKSYSIKHVVEGPMWDPEVEGYHVTSLRAGYSAIGCEVALSNNWVSVCGYDEATDIRIGDCGERYGRRGFSSMALYHPATEFSALALVIGNTPEAAKTRHCQIFDKSGALIDSDACLQEVVLVSNESGQRTQHLITWPSGARTVIEIAATEHQTTPSYSINGNEGALVTLVNASNCIVNTASGNTFCLSDA